MTEAGGVGVHSSDGQLLSAHRARRPPSYDSSRLACAIVGGGQGEVLRCEAIILKRNSIRGGRERGCVDASESTAAFSYAEGRPPAGSAGRPLRLTVSDRTRASPSCMASGRPFLLSTSTCQDSRSGIQSNSHLVRTLQLASLRVRPARGSRVAPMPVWGRYVALATDHEQDAAPSRDIHCDLRSRAERPSRRRNAFQKEARYS